MTDSRDIAVIAADTLMALETLMSELEDERLETITKYADRGPGYAYLAMVAENQLAAAGRRRLGNVIAWPPGPVKARIVIRTPTGATRFDGEIEVRAADGVLVGTNPYGFVGELQLDDDKLELRIAERG